MSKTVSFGSGKPTLFTFTCLKIAVNNLEIDGLSLDVNIDSTDRTPLIVTEFMPNIGPGKALKLIETTMKKVDHVLCNGEVYGKPAGSRRKYVVFYSCSKLKKYFFLCCCH